MSNYPKIFVDMSDVFKQRHEKSIEDIRSELEEMEKDREEYLKKENEFAREKVETKKIVDDLMSMKEATERNKKQDYEKFKLHINPADRANAEMLGMVEGEHFLVYDYVPASFVFIDDTMVHFTVIADMIRGDHTALSFELPKQHFYIPGAETCVEPMNREQRRKAAKGKRNGSGKYKKTY